MTMTMTNTDDYNYSQILSDCETWAEDAAVLARKYFRQTNEVEFKADESPVTVIDQLIENEIKNAIALKYPAVHLSATCQGRSLKAPSVGPICQ